MMALYEEFEPQPNRLANAHSAYLRGAALQPVGWYEYGPEAFAEARRQQKPLFLDIGAAWCHWCHVIDRESYEDPDIATYLNELYIPVKVDRDERPDIDARYQVAVQLLTGQGGWPLTVFLDAEGQPFYGGTYFPPEDRDGRVGFKRLLPQLADTFRHHKDELEEAACALSTRTRLANLSMAEAAPIGPETLQRITQSLQSHFNAEQGGFEHAAPKFPHPAAIELALRQCAVTSETPWRAVVETTLTAMGHGGIYDQLGGGFHRYTTDKHWIVPHFEKLAYDNALLLTNYVHAYALTGNLYYREIADGTLNFLLRELTDHKRGGFYSSQDADSDLHDDGHYWTWTHQELLESLPAEEFVVLARHYGISRAGNMPGTQRNVLHIAEPLAQIAARLQLPLVEVEARLLGGKRKLLALRHRRITPRVDTTKYAGWNALLASALLEAGTLLGRADALQAALQGIDTLLRDAYEPDHGIYHIFHTAVGADLPGFLDDQLYSAQALLGAYSVIGNAKYLDTARQLLDLCLARYWDDDQGGFFDRASAGSSTGPEFLQQPRKAIDDQPTPAPNAVVVLLMDRLDLLTIDEQYRGFARRTLEAFARHAPEYGTLAATYGLALSYHLQPPLWVTIAGAGDDARTQALRQAALECWQPGLFLAVPPADHQAQYPLGPEGQPLAYVCAGETCAEPTGDVEELRRIMREHAEW